MRSEPFRVPQWLRALWICVLFHAPATRAAELGVEDAIQIALERNPEVRLAATEVDVLRAKQTGASRLLKDNPQLSASVGPRFRAEGDILPSYTIALSQPIEIGGQRAARLDVVEAGLRAVEARLAARRSSAVADVRQAFGRALAAQAEMKVAEEGLALAKQALAAAEERHRAGDASLVEVNTARIEVGRASRERIASTQSRKLSLAELKLLLFVESEEELLLQGSLAALTHSTVAGPNARELARAQRADLVAARAELEAAEAEARLAAREGIPTPSLGVSYGGEERAHIVLGTLSVDLPFFNRNQAERGVASARASQSRIALEALERRVQQEVDLAIARRDAAQAAVSAFGGEVVQAAESNLELANEGYRAGQLDFLQLLLIRRATLDSRRGQIEALEELNRAEARLDLVLGAAHGLKAEATQ